MANEAELMQVRFEKEDKLKEYGINTRPEKYERTVDIEGARALEDGTKDVSYLAGKLRDKEPSNTPTHPNHIKCAGWYVGVGRK